MTKPLGPQGFDLETILIAATLAALLVILA